MYVVMAKPDRIEMRIAQDLKEQAVVVAEMRRSTVTGLLTQLLVAEIDQVLRNNRAGYDDAAKRVADALTPKGKVAKVAISHDAGNVIDSKHGKRSTHVSKDSRRRAISGGRKR